MKGIKKSFEIIFVISIVLSVIFFLDNNWLKVQRYNINSSKLPEEFNGFKIVQLSDLHSKVFGKNNVQLLNKIRKINPDIIVITGDMLNSENDNGESFLNLARNLNKEYKMIYYVEGNHEQIAKSIADTENSEWFNEYMNKLKKSGIIVLNNDKIELKKGNQIIKLYGLGLPLSYYKGKDSERLAGEKEYQISDIKNSIGQADKEKFNILLTHNPKYFPVYSSWGADLTLAGHIHGGYVRLPFVGGVFSPDKTLFPEYDAGEFENASSKMIVSCGLGNGKIGFRIFNRPEITVITLGNS
ncbi:MAG: metallophosphoesterase [Clostridiaceae bacterium]